jgi:hypothetical protein
MKVVINTCFGGFGLSHEAIMLYSELAKLNLMPVRQDSSWTPYTYYIDGVQDGDHFWSEYSLKRDDPDLVAVVETLGKAADDQCAELKVVEIPDGIDWYIDEYDGREHVAERHRTWS